MPNWGCVACRGQSALGKPGIGRAVALSAVALAVATAMPSSARSEGIEPGAIQREFKPQKQPDVGARIQLRSPVVQPPPAAAASTMLVLQDLQIEGATVFSLEKLSVFASPLMGKEVSLADIFGVAQSITKLYSDRGYPLSVAFVPAQEIKDGRVKIQVIEGYVAEIEIAGDAGPSAKALAAIAEKLKAERPLTQSALERYLLLANDLPGLNVRAVIDHAPEQNGGVKMILAVRRQAVRESAGINNRGSKALGRERGVLSFSEFGGMSGRERIDLDLVQTIEKSELTYLHGRFETIVDAEGTSLAVDGAWSESAPGTAPLKAVDFNGTGRSLSFEVSSPLERSRARNIKLIGQFEVDDYRGDFGAVPNSQDKLRILRGTLYSAFADAYAGVTQTEITLSQGLGIFDATSASDPLKSRANGSAVFSSASATFSHLHPGQYLDLWVSVTAQVASRALLASEECGYGGARFGRAFDNFDISGENCVLAQAELRHPLAIARGGFGGQLYSFYDAGMVRQKGTLLPGELRHEDGQSTGFGLRFNFGKHVNGSLEYTHPMSRDLIQFGYDPGRMFFSLSLSR
jgi:hemolysin activation/secretion protein